MVAFAAGPFEQGARHHAASVVAPVPPLTPTRSPQYFVPSTPPCDAGATRDSPLPTTPAVASPVPAEPVVVVLPEAPVVPRNCEEGFHSKVCQFGVTNLEDVLSADSPETKETGSDGENSHILYQGAVPHGGRLRFFLDRWRQVTNDPLILEIIRGYRFEFENQPPHRILPSQVFHNHAQNTLV